MVHPIISNISDPSPPEDIAWAANQSSCDSMDPLGIVPPLNLSGLTEDNVHGLYELIWPE